MPTSPRSAAILGLIAAHGSPPVADLFTIDAGDKPTAVRLRMRQRRVEHVLTDKEIADKERYRYSFAPKYDFVSTDRMRLEIKESSSSAYVIEDTAGTRIESKLIRAIEGVEEASVKERERVEWRHQRDIEIAEEHKGGQRSFDVAPSSTVLGSRP